MDKNNNLIVPLAIIIAGVFVAGAIYFSSAKTDDNPTENKDNAEEIAFEPVDADDHIFGNPDAPIYIVEYSDTECPFCKSYHETMNKVMEEYGKDGKVAWIYRHFPIDSRHPKARKEAEATECAADIGGNDAFWRYLNRLMEITPSNNGLDLALLPDVAEYVGLDRGSFEECLSSGKMANRVEEDFQSGIKAGVRGTPLSIVVTNKDGKRYPINGAQSYITVKSIIDAGLKDAEN